MSDPSQDRPQPKHCLVIPPNGRRRSRFLGAHGRTPRLRIAAVVAALAISAGVMSVVTAGANTNTPTVTYYACVSNLGGVPYNVQTTGAPKCLGNNLVDQLEPDRTGRNAWHQRDQRHQRDKRDQWNECYRRRCIARSQLR